MPVKQKTRSFGSQTKKTKPKVSQTKGTRTKSSQKTAPSFESVWAALQETDRQRKESFKEIVRMQEETALSMKDTDKKIKLLSSQMGNLSNKFGEMAEHLVAPGIIEKFNSLGYHFDGIADRGYKILEGNDLKTEIDILLENGDFIVAVEVKADVRKGDIEHHIQRLKILRKHRNEKNDKRKIYGAIAGAIFYPSIKKAAIENGLYVLEQSGDTMKMVIPKGFKPKEW